MLERPTNKTARAGERKVFHLRLLHVHSSQLEEEKHYDIFRHVIITDSAAAVA